jgi:3-phenylpropionate/cinnamic acid dioxygenase small subunit
MPSDTEAIAALIYTYAERLDAGDLEGVAQLFAQATLRSDVHAEVLQGSEQALELYRNTVALYDGKPWTKHLITNLIIEVDAASGTAAARSYYTVLQARPELPLQIIIAGRYHDRFARLAGEWCFTDRLFFVDLLGDLRFHLRHNPLAPA